MKKQMHYIVPAFVLLLLAACAREDKPPEVAKAAAPAPAAAPTETELVMPDPCSLLDAAVVAKAAGWKSATPKAVQTTAIYIAACDFTDAADAKHVVKLVLTYGALIPDDSAHYAELVGDKGGLLKKPATPVNNLGEAVIEMDGGPGAQSMQTRIDPTAELTVTADTMPITRVLFPQALINLRKILPVPAPLQKRNDS
jgi:hypothetical protein